ncbi:MAG: AAA family ATPase [Spirochaetaceae bacterium]|nr:AAA family ATPase [Spirochaetaceae bacterium]
MEPKFIVLTGMKHCGKSTTGRELARRLGLPFFDIDDRITVCSGKTPRELYDQGGAELFRAREAAAAALLAEELNSGVKTGQPAAVIAAGGGLCDNEAAVAALKRGGLFVYLSAPEELLMERILASAERDGRFPAYISCRNPQNKEEISAIFHSYYILRTEKYDILADMLVQTERKSIGEITEGIIQGLSPILNRRD